MSDNIVVKYFNKISSTNSIIKKDITNGQITNPSAINLYITHKQTNGRGRSGHTFYSKSKGLYFSILIPLTFIRKFNQKSNPLFTIISAVSISEELKSMGINTSIKWVNDILLDNKKVAGILTEAIINHPNLNDDYIIIGIGINLINKKFPKDIQNIATSLNLDKHTCSKDFRIKLATNITNRILEYIKTDTNSYLLKYKNLMSVIGKNISYTIKNKSYEGIAIDLNNQGNLLVQLDSGQIITIDSGEITI